MMGCRLSHPWWTAAVLVAGAALLGCASQVGDASPSDAGLVAGAPAPSPTPNPGLDGRDRGPEDPVNAGAAEAAGNAVCTHDGGAYAAAGC